MDSGITLRSKWEAQAGATGEVYDIGNLGSEQTSTSGKMQVGAFSPCRETRSAGSLEMNRTTGIQNTSLSRSLGGHIRRSVYRQGKGRNAKLWAGRSPWLRACHPIPTASQGVSLLTAFCCHPVSVVTLMKLMLSDSRPLFVALPSLPHFTSATNLNIISQNCATAKASLTKILPSSCQWLFTEHKVLPLFFHSITVVLTYPLSLSLDCLVPLLFPKPFSSGSAGVCPSLGCQGIDSGLTESTTQSRCLTTGGPLACINIFVLLLKPLCQSPTVLCCKLFVSLILPIQPLTLH